MQASTEWALFRVDKNLFLPNKLGGAALRHLRFRSIGTTSGNTSTLIAHWKHGKGVQEFKSLVMMHQV